MADNPTLTSPECEKGIHFACQRVMIGSELPCACTCHAGIKVE